ncbi:transcription-repair-coupling factor [Anaerotignum neopropionicum]|uniref:Transcription-repair-coupling factor n=1 Tax=Anaerotignum neopropionicum TaxID=36847 RepID=A0A136WBE1_9FIRM|nr:transcription-repair coupling factor [Anaerotignum neopropionicum]KXL51831.1 transcription-repair-coupling factor [Anaerotignum neopropionicum]
MKALTEPLLELEGYQNVLEAIRKNHTPVFTTGVIDVEKTHLLYSIKEHCQRPLLILTYSELRAREILEEFSFFHKNPIYYPAKDILFYSADVHSMEMNRHRFHAMERLLSGERPVIVASVEALLDRYPQKELFTQFIATLKVGDIIDINKLTKQLICLGYERAELVESPGQFALRGGILDIYSLTAEDAVRIEFWDDEIDSIRSMDAASQRSVDKLEEARIFPMRELVYEESMAEQAANKISKEFGKCLQNMTKKGLVEESERLKENIGEDAERLRIEKNLANIGVYISYFYENTVSLLDYIPEDTLLCFDEPERIREHMAALMAEYEESMKGRIAQGYLLPGQAKLLFDYTDILRQGEGFDRILLAGLNQRTSDFEPKVKVNFAVRSTPSFSKRVDLFCEELQYLKKNEHRILILGGTGSRAQRMAKELSEMDIPAVYMENLDSPMPKGAVWVTKGSLSKGFGYEYINLTVFSDSELFGGGEKKRKNKKRKNGAAIESFTDLKVGDYVVHDNHGIGVFGGLEKISVEGVQKDYMKISYRDGGNLFVPVNQMDMVQKYIGSGGAAPKMNKLGGQDWVKAKAKTRAAIKILAEDLVALYAKRASTKGFQYARDTVWQREFEEAFPYAETDDQLNAIEDVKHDMQSSKVMDRLICGDVGYGKTEVAIRAAFKAVQDGKQVAFLVPTTILAQQHYNTFVQRMSGYPITVELLSRFRTAKQQKESLKKLQGGYGDIVIGTHRILSKDVVFKDLGLIIVDEEQRFGVSHKEKLKRLRENVDVLTLSATPIPRTLHMSLSGIRDMSLLEEPPLERHPIQTYVMENNPEFVREAIHREVARGGQVYYLYNRVESIREEAFRLQKMVPEANIAYAHGQMSERELERIMEAFISGETDVLVCTTIIETGMDIANANTIIIQDADIMGLAQLYQLRGRVGRSNRIAYAYLMYRRDKMLREVAEKRLQTIREFTEFGSGFKIAMRDLEIRGAGNLLGAEQHGHMESVGYDMYCRLLEEEVQQLKGEAPKEEPFETTVDLNISAYIPDFYIKNQEQRMELYKKIANVRIQEEYYDIQEEMEDRYGDLPKSVQTLLEIVLLKSEARSLGISSIVQKRGNILFEFRADAKTDPLKLTKLISQGRGKYLFTAGASPYLTLKLNKEKETKVLEEIKFVLNAIK